MARLTSEELLAALAHLSGWRTSTDETAIERTVEFDDFQAAFAFMTAVALDAQEIDHHPNWSNAWNTVEFRLTTHDSGGVTRRDFELARAIDVRAAMFGAHDL